MNRKAFLIVVLLASLCASTLPIQPVSAQTMPQLENQIRVFGNTEAIKLLEAGFEYVTDMTNGDGNSTVKIFRKSK